MSRFAYVIRQSGSGDPAHAWELELNERPVAHFATLVSALGSAKSLHDIDGRTGASPTVDVQMPYGRFRVHWVDGSSDAVCLSNVTDEFEPPAGEPHALPRAAGAPPG